MKTKTKARRGRKEEGKRVQRGRRRKKGKNKCTCSTYVLDGRRMGRDWLTPPVPPRAPRAPSPRSRGECASSKPRTTATIRESFSGACPDPRESIIRAGRTNQRPMRSNVCIFPTFTCAILRVNASPLSPSLPLPPCSPLAFRLAPKSSPRVVHPPMRQHSSSPESGSGAEFARRGRNLVLVNRYRPRVIHEESSTFHSPISSRISASRDELEI